MTCLFCRIVSAELPARVVVKDELVTAFLDLRQPHRGHTLVVPNRHVENLYDLEDEDGRAVISCAGRVARALRTAFDPQGLSLWQSNGPAAFQEVPHFHLHVMPRWTEDGLLRIYPHRLQPLSGDELDDQAAAIRAVL